MIPGVSYDLVHEHQLSVPVVQAPMAGTSTIELALQVAGAGGMTSIAVGTLTPGAATNIIRSFRRQSGRSLNVNVFCHRPAIPNPVVEKNWLAALSPMFHSLAATPPETLREIYSTFVGHREMVDALTAERPAVISFHFGLPDRSTISALKNAGIRLWSTATNLDEALSAEGAGVDAIVAQGFEAGGHRGVFDPDAADSEVGTLALVRMLTEKIGLPVIAAGGIMDGAGIAAALQAGAVAAQLGTAFIACPESSADIAYRAKLFSDAARHTTMTRHISGRPARCLANAFTALAATLNDVTVPDYPITYDAGKALNEAARRAGNIDFGAHWAGQGARLARSMPAAELVRTLAAELAVALQPSSD